MLTETAKEFYIGESRNCAMSVLMAANKEYELSLTEKEMQLAAGFGGGLGCGNTCGALCGAIASLSMMYKGEELKNICGKMTNAFDEKFGTTMCKEIAPKYKTPELRCFKTVELACQILEQFVPAK